MGQLEDQLLYNHLKARGFRWVDRRVVASEEHFTRGDPTQPNPTREHPRARVIYGQDTPVGNQSRTWQAAEIARRRPIEGGGRPRSMPYTPVPSVGTRALGEIRAAILHQTTFHIPPVRSRPGPVPADPAELRRYIERDDHRVDHIIAHFVVLRDGTVVYLRDVTHRLNSVSFGPGIDIEFEGDYPHDATPPASRDRRLPVIAIRAGRALVGGLATAFGVRFVVTHGQVQKDGDKLDSCPGPDIWMNVGQWAVEPGGELRLSSDARPAFGRDEGLGAQRNAAYLQVV